MIGTEKTGGFDLWSTIPPKYGARADLREHARRGMLREVTSMVGEILADGRAYAVRVSESPGETDLDGTLQVGVRLVVSLLEPRECEPGEYLHPDALTAPPGEVVFRLEVPDEPARVFKRSAFGWLREE